MLAGDLPWIAPAVPASVAALAQPGIDVVELVDAEGRANHLAAAWRRPALVAALSALGDPAGAAMRALVAGVGRPRCPTRPAGAVDCDTWDDVARAQEGGAQATTRSSPA